MEKLCFVNTTECGTKSEGFLQESEREVRKEKKNKNKKILVGIAVVLAVLITGLLAVNNNGKSQKNSIEAEMTDEEKKTDEGTDLEGLIGESEQKLEELGLHI